MLTDSVGVLAIGEFGSSRSRRPALSWHFDQDVLRAEAATRR
ncbi:hypothetical protein OG298_03460 [Streptomyces sp. NBC_01005]|nr:hypothetical protein [Streptomyces sp. NBC_01362]WSW03469.1 hypothetical protein OG298_03460 [Streptomyces sp. NBC_01005]WTC92972.1 hypothetical protein OH736_03455 [Streptomyces sp. NBC_01650]